jgi:DNA invertase Pin-like site-specific DNA recombinase
MIYCYVRVSNQTQNLEGQKNLISRYVTDHKLMIDEWIEVSLSSKKSTTDRQIDSLLQKLQAGDTVIVSELSRLGRSIKETLNTIEEIVTKKQTRLILIKQNLDMNPQNKNSMMNKVMITVFSMIAELERDFISERTKEGLLARKARGIKLGKLTGVIQSSMYDKDQDKLMHLYQLGVPIKKIINTHICYGKYSSLKDYIDKRKNAYLLQSETAISS